MLKIHLEDSDSYMVNLDDMVANALTDFPDDEDKSGIANYAAKLAQSYITGDTRSGHVRCVIYNDPLSFFITYNYRSIAKAYINYHRQRKPTWDAKAVTGQTPRDITEFITYKCGPKEEGFEGKKVLFLLIFSTHPADHYYIVFDSCFDSCCFDLLVSKH